MSIAAGAGLSDVDGHRAVRGESWSDEHRRIAVGRPKMAIVDAGRNGIMQAAR